MDVMSKKKGEIHSKLRDFVDIADDITDDRPWLDVFRDKDRETTETELKELVEVYRDQVDQLKMLKCKLKAYSELEKEIIDNSEVLQSQLKFISTYLRVVTESQESIAELITAKYEEAKKTGGAQVLKDFSPEQIKKAIPSRGVLQALKNYGIMNDKINNKICEIEPQRQGKNADNVENEWLINTLGDNLGGSAVSVLLSLNEKDTSVKVGRILNTNDFAVCNAIATRYYYDSKRNESGSLLITPAEIWRTMNGINDARKSPTPKQLKEITASIDKMRFTSLKIDLNTEKAAGIETPDNDFIKDGRIETYFIKADKADFVTTKGKKVACYKIDEMPALYAYNEMRKHTVYVPFEIMDVSDEITRNDNETTVIKEYLAREIQGMKAGRRNNIMVYDTIYIKSGLPIPGQELKEADYTNEKQYQNAIRKAQLRGRKKINDILKSFQNKGFIKGFEDIKEGQKITKVRIITSENMQKKEKQAEKK